MDSAKVCAWRMVVVTLLVGSLAFLAGCDSDATIASRNLSKAADKFEITRRVVFYNGITGDYMLTIEGRCSIQDQAKQLEVTCKTGDASFKKHFLRISDNVTYFAEQVEGANVSVFHHRVTFKPQSLLPDIGISGNVEELLGRTPSD